MRRDWQPGDVALVNDCTHPEAPWKPATCKEAAIPGQRETVWILHDSGARVWGSVTDARPLVVIDPEDREQVEHLISIEAAISTSAQHYGLPPTDRVQAALREFANPTPPKPVEPTGLGAVVEDVDCDRWVRTDDEGEFWWHPPSRKSAKWTELRAVRVLSEGVAQ